MKKKIFFLLAVAFLSMFCFLGVNSNLKTIIAKANKDYQNPGSGSSTTFDHIDIESAASFTYYVDGKPVVVNINFYEDNSNLSKINIYKKNKDNTLTEIPVTGKWQNQAGTSGESSSNKEYRISGTFDKYYNSTSTTKEEVVYVVKFTLSVTIGGVEQELVYTEEYSYSSANNVCPGDSTNKGIDVLISGEKLESYFSASLKIIKNVENADDNTFTFRVKAVNSSVDFDKTIEIKTDDLTGSIILGGLKAGEKYTITEINIPDGYELVTDQPIQITAEQNKTIEVTFTNRAKTIDITGTKTWEDNSNQDGIRPDSITVNLLKNGTKITSQEVTSENNWTYCFNDLPEYEDGEAIIYTVTEEAVEGYEATITGYDITNTHTPEVTSVEGSKTWEDNNDQDGIRPETITVNLYKNGTKVSSKEVTSKNNWTYSFTNLPKYENGEEITYTVTEEAVEGYEATVTGYDITNTHTPEITSVEGSKTWEDNNNQDGIRPTSITVNLYKNGTKITSQEVTAKDNWTYSFINLPKYENGEEITYTVTEEAVEGYEATVTNYDITNTHTPEVTSVEGSKTWEDKDNQDGIRPTSITVNLYKNGTKITSQEVTAKDNWTYSFTNLPKYENGSIIEYTIKEESVSGYTTIIDGYNITNIHETETTIVSVTKTWIDNNNQDGIRPETITINLLKNGQTIASKQVTQNDNWSYTFKDLDKYENGKEITYTVTEEAVEGYITKINGYDITNTHTPEETEVVGKKIWHDNNNQDGFRPESITVRLYANNQEVENAIITEGENKDWTYAFKNLPKYKNGEEIIYTVTEDSVAEYTTTYLEENPYIIVNTHLTKTIDINGTKTWDDNNNQDGFRPESITVRLSANGVEIDSKVVTEATDWTYSFTNLDMYEDGKIISYTITEDAIENYSTTIDEYNITNTHTPETITVSGTKTWTDNDNQDGIRPEVITINLLKNGQKITSKEVTEATNWTYTFENLAKYENGQEIEYTLTEETVEGYETKINGYDVTNTHEIEKITFKATKIWEDNDNQDGIRQDKINVNLYKNGELYQTVTITEEDNWTYEFKDLDRYENGQAIVYTIEEEIVLGYNTQINYNEIDENNIISAVIINTHTPEETTIEINKIWNDYDNLILARPNSIEVELYANGEYLKTIIITDENDWTYAIAGLPKYQNGQEIIYTISEKAVEGYTTTYDGFNITNTIEFGKGGDVEELPPQTGINQATTNHPYNPFIIILAGLFLFIKKFI